MKDKTPPDVKQSVCSKTQGRAGSVASRTSKHIGIVNTLLYREGFARSHALDAWDPSPPLPCYVPGIKDGPCLHGALSLAGKWHQNGSCYIKVEFLICVISVVSPGQRKHTVI